MPSKRPSRSFFRNSPHQKGLPVQAFLANRLTIQYYILLHFLPNLSSLPLPCRLWQARWGKPFSSRSVFQSRGSTLVPEVGSKNGGGGICVRNGGTVFSLRSVNRVIKLLSLFCQIPSKKRHNASCDRQKRLQGAWWGVILVLEQFWRRPRRIYTCSGFSETRRKWSGRSFIQPVHLTFWWAEPIAYDSLSRGAALSVPPPP